MGAFNDGENNETDNCPPSDNYLMTPGLMASQSGDKIKNLLRFSDCTVQKLKQVLLAKDKMYKWLKIIYY